MMAFNIIAQWKEQFQNEMIAGSNPALCSNNFNS